MLLSSQKSFWPRLATFHWIAAVVYIYLFCGLFWRQIIQHSHFSNLEKRQSYRRILKIAPRGNIYDRNGNLLAGNRPRFSLVAHLMELRGEFHGEYLERARLLRRQGLEVSLIDEQSIARRTVLQRHLDRINRILGKDFRIDERQLRRHWQQELLLPMTLIADLSSEDFAKLIEILTPGEPLQLQTDATRLYPHHHLAAHVIGYASPTTEPAQDDLIGSNFKTFNPRGTVGRAGVEEYFDEFLRGRNGGEIWIVDPSGKQSERIFSQEVSRGNNLILSLDIDLQRVAEEALGDEIGCVILSEIDSGEILVMASRPGFDLNDLTPSISPEIYRAITARGAWLNSAVQGVYPLGSVFKMMTALSLVKHGVVNASTKHGCEGVARVGDRIIRCNNHFERGELSFARALAKSCNTFVVDLIFEIPLNTFLADIRTMGFGQKTGIELPYETRYSLVPTPQWKKEHGYSRWTDGDTANLAIGQGYFLASPLQVNAFTLSLAGRRERTPLSILHDPQAHRKHLAEIAKPLSLSDDDYGAFLQGLKECVEYGSGKRCQIPGIAVAGKTGTAQIKDQGKNSHLAWFSAFAPADHPRVAITIVLREPYGGRSYGGGSDAAPIAQRILLEYFRSLSSRQ